jgi:hypothetical protein
MDEEEKENAIIVPEGPQTDILKPKLRIATRNSDQDVVYSDLSKFIQVPSEVKRDMVNMLETGFIRRSEASKRYNIHENTLGNWVRNHRNGKGNYAESHRPPPSSQSSATENDHQREH